MPASTRSRRKPPPLRCVFGIHLRFRPDQDAAITAAAKAAGISVNRMAELAINRGLGLIR